MTFNSGKLNYQFSPTPHNDPCYNKNQAKFYKQDAAQEAFFYSNLSPSSPK